MWICTVICPHINVNVLAPLYTCCIITGLIVCEAVVKGQKGKSAFPGMFCLGQSGVPTGVGGCSQTVIWTCTVRLHSSTSTGFSTTRHSEEVSAGDSWCLGSCTAAGWLGKGPSSADPGGAFASAQLSTQPPPPPRPAPPCLDSPRLAPPRSHRSPSAETSRRDSWPVLPRREEAECLFVFTRSLRGGLHKQ